MRLAPQMREIGGRTARFGHGARFPVRPSQPRRARFPKHIRLGIAARAALFAHGARFIHFPTQTL